MHGLNGRISSQRGAIHGKPGQAWQRKEKAEEVGDSEDRSKIHAARE
jgi:hypothetical protein